ncbi:MAG: hypothetical protein GXY50_02340 [Syntrophomonadaceae bacterium]|nr:hypothetical protein [Syntrophomonadaceae bacterium]
MIEYRPHVNTDIGPGCLYRIVGAMAHVEFDYMYLVEIPLSKVCLKNIDLSKVDGGVIDETMERRTDNRKSG